MSDFSLEFLTAVVDTLLPGLPATADQPALPAASQIGLERHLLRHLLEHPQREQLTQRLHALAKVAGGVENFSLGDVALRTAAVQTLEQSDSAAFYAFLLVIAAAYYQTDEVIRALGWYVDPPQPRGYPLPLFDEQLLTPVKTRAALWRA
ncbi:MAG: hypothetical protein U0350_48910 [Caldilineaceae bacterium]